MVVNNNNNQLYPYSIRVETGNQAQSGTDANIKIVITGTEGQTRPITLDKKFHNDMERGKTDEYQVHAIDVGQIVSIKLINERQFNWIRQSDWLVRRVLVAHWDRNILCEFRCYRWVKDELVLYQGKAVLPQYDHQKETSTSRKLELEKRQQQYQWNELKDMPGFLLAEEHKHVPHDSQFTDVSSKSLKSNVFNAVLINTIFNTIVPFRREFSDFEDFTSCYTFLIKEQIPKVTKNDKWKDDVIFGKHTLNGANPMLIERCDKLPDGFPVTHDMVGNLLDRELTLEQEMKEGHVYIANLHHLCDIKHKGAGTKDELYFCEPVVLFYVRSTGDLVPIAIQLFQEHSDTNPIWTPNDDPLEWLFAKMWYKNADLQVHQMLVHLLRTHLAIEPVAVATWRQLPSIHPIHKLLFPHIRSVMAINTIGRKELIGEGGISDEVLSIGGGGHMQIMQEFYKKHFTWALTDIPGDLKRRGVDDIEKLPGFYYRDDALAMWDALKTFITQVVSVYYQRDSDVQNDYEVQGWVQDIAENGYPTKEGQVDHEFPSTLKSREQLVHLLTCVIFTCSCQHAAVNFSQFEVLSYSPLAPPTMRKPPPTKKGEVTMKTILETLPNKRIASLHIGTTYVLTRYAKDEKYLGDYSDGLFTNQDEVWDAIKSLQENLDKISATIKERNKALEVPYEYLLPERVPNSVAI